MELEIRGVKVTLSDLRRDVQAAKDKGLTGQHAFMPETVEALLDLIEAMKRNYTHEDIKVLFDAGYRAQLQRLSSSDERSTSAQMDEARLAALKGLEIEGLARRENTYDWTIWHFVPTDGPAVPMYRVRN